MGNDFLSIIKTDLIQAKIIQQQPEKLSCWKFIFIFLRSRTCRIHTFVRLRSKGKFLSYIAKKYLDRYFIEVGSDTRIGKYFWMPHPRCIIIADTVEIGEHVYIGQYVTIGGNFKKIKVLKVGGFQKLPIIGSRVMINPGAVIGGPVSIGDDVIIGANAVVTKDVPSNTIVYGQNQLSDKKISIPNEGGHYTVMDEK